MSNQTPDPTQSQTRNERPQELNKTSTIQRKQRDNLRQQHTEENEDRP